MRFTVRSGELPTTCAGAWTVGTSRPTSWAFFSTGSSPRTSPSTSTPASARPGTRTSTTASCRTPTPRAPARASLRKRASSSPRGTCSTTCASGHHATRTSTRPSRASSRASRPPRPARARSRICAACSTTWTSTPPSWAGRWLSAMTSSRGSCRRSGTWTCLTGSPRLTLSATPTSFS